MKGINPRLQFHIELRELLNKHSIENDSDTPDYVLAAYLERCLDAFMMAAGERDEFYGFEPRKIGGTK